MTRLIPLILIALGIWFWLRAKRKTAAYMAAHESGGHDVRRDDREPRDEPRDPAA